MLEFDDIEEAILSVRETSRKTPFVFSNSFSDILDSQVYLKLENQQRTGSFKIRGATNRIANCIDECKDGVVTASAGNHAQGVALASTRQGIDSTVFMPKIAPKSKIIATRDYGAEVKLRGRTYGEAHEFALDYSDENDLEYVPAYDDTDVMAGQGTIGIEIHEQHDGQMDKMIVPIGGGGLISGISTAMKELYEDIEVIGVEPEETAKVSSSIQQGKPVHRRIGCLTRHVSVSLSHRMSESVHLEVC